MNFKYLGTAAAEGVPSMFCRCKVCEEARRKGGKNLRTRSQAIINDDLLIDFSSDTFGHSMKYNIHMDSIKYILFTHSHLDHCNIADMVFRGAVFAHEMKEPLLTIYGNKAVRQAFEAVAEKEMISKVREGYLFKELKAYDVINIGKYKITALPARHMETEQAFIFIIESEGKAVLYGNDTGMIYDEVFQFLKKKKIYFNLISLDCTMLENTTRDTDTHMDITRCVRSANKLRENGNIDEKTVVCVTHFSHNGNPMHKRLEEYLLPLGILPAYDGLEINV